MQKRQTRDHKDPVPTIRAPPDIKPSNLYAGIDTTDPGSRRTCSDDLRSSILYENFAGTLEQKSFIVYCERIDYSPRPFSSSNFILKIIILEGVAEKTDPGSQGPCSDDSCTTWYKNVTHPGANPLQPFTRKFPLPKGLLFFAYCIIYRPFLTLILTQRQWLISQQANSEKVQKNKSWKYGLTIGYLREQQRQ